MLRILNTLKPETPAVVQNNPKRLSKPEILLEILKGSRGSSKLSKPKVNNEVQLVQEVKTEADFRILLLHDHYKDMVYH